MGACGGEPDEKAGGGHEEYGARLRAAGNPLCVEKGDNAFTDSEEQREVASLFNATIHLENEGEQQRAFSDALLRIKEESLKEKNRTWDPSDMAGLQELIKAKKELEDLGRKRQQLHISFN